MNEELNKYAASNTPRLQNEVNSLVNIDFNSVVFNKFLTFCEIHKKICINLSLESLKKVIASGAYKNIFELGIATNEIKKKYSTEYYDKLVAFVSRFDTNRNLKYGSFNIGGLGSTLKIFGGGTVCIILNSGKILENCKILCLATFSLDYYDVENVLNLDKMQNEISNWSDVSFLALIKHKLAIETINESQWPNKVYDFSGKLIELLIDGDLPIDFIEEIRVQERFYKTIMEDKKKMKMEKIDLIGMNNISNFATIEEFVNNSNIKLTRI